MVNYAIIQTPKKLINYCQNYLLPSFSVGVDHFWQLFISDCMFSKNVFNKHFFYYSEIIWR